MKPLPHLDVEADLGKIVEAAINDPPGKRILAASDMVSWSDQLKTWCDINQVSFGGFDSLPIEVYESFFPVKALGTELGEMMAFMDDFGYAGREGDVMPASEVC